MMNGNNATTRRLVVGVLKNRIANSNAIHMCSGRNPMHRAVTASHTASAHINVSDSLLVGTLLLIDNY